MDTSAASLCSSLLSVKPPKNEGELGEVEILFLLDSAGFSIKVLFQIKRKTLIF